MIYLNKTDIGFTNQRTVAEQGGNFIPPSNFLHEENLDYLVEAIQAEGFGRPSYPALTNKAAVYCFDIIAHYIVTGGNKRTGLEAALAFLKLNGMRLNRKLPQNDVFDFILKVASGVSSLDGCRAWFADYVVSNG